MSGDPGECDLGCGAAPLRSERLDLFNDGFVLIEVLALKLGDYKPGVSYCDTSFAEKGGAHSIVYLPDRLKSLGEKSSGDL
jgi:hypothetical protein